MGKRKLLYQTQREILKDLFYGDMDEESVFKKHGIMRSTLNRWLEDEVFAEQFRQHIKGLVRKNELLVAKSAGSAAEQLVKLTKCEKSEVARKACVDIIAMARRLSEAGISEKEPKKTAERQAGQLPATKASRILAVLAEKEGRK